MEEHNLPSNVTTKCSNLKTEPVTPKVPWAVTISLVPKDIQEFPPKNAHAPFSMQMTTVSGSDRVEPVTWPSQRISD